jgi:hypothetical protein
MKTDKTDNVLIAEFMGAEWNPLRGCWRGGEGGIKQYLHNASKVEFHASWDWLMPVWKKFREINLGNDYAQGVFNNYLAKIAHKIAWEEIKDVHYILVLGIKWYNSHKQ